MTPAEVRRMRPLLGTYVEVGARGALAESATQAAFAAIEKAQALWSFHDAGSELSQLNRQPQRRIALMPATTRLLRAARALMQASQGAFDCTVGGMLVREGVLPDHGGPEALLSGIAHDIEIGPGWALLRRPIRVTLDGIAKGYAVDLAVSAMRRCGVRSGWINAGGDLRAFGDATLPVHRRELDGQLVPLGELHNAAIATSMITPESARDARFPGRIVSTTAFAPACGVWSVLAHSAWRADALTKVAACTPAAQRQSTVASLGGCLVGASA